MTATEAIIRHVYSGRERHELREDAQERNGFGMMHDGEEYKLRMGRRLGANAPALGMGEMVET